jgi:hypothetical protein
MLCQIIPSEVLPPMDNLTHIKYNLEKRHRRREAIMYDAVKNRLSKSLSTYEKTLDKGVLYIETKNELKVISKL